MHLDGKCLGPQLPTGSNQKVFHRSKWPERGPQRLNNIKNWEVSKNNQEKRFLTVPHRNTSIDVLSENQAKQHTNALLHPGPARSCFWHTLHPSHMHDWQKKTLKMSKFHRFAQDCLNPCFWPLVPLPLCHQGAWRCMRTSIENTNSPMTTKCLVPGATNWSCTKPFITQMVSGIEFQDNELMVKSELQKRKSVQPGCKLASECTASAVQEIQWSSFCMAKPRKQH